MKRLSVRTLVVGSIVALGAIATPKDAEASGYLTARYGTDYGTPATGNTFAVYFNPAALGGTQGTTITGDVSAVMRFVRYTRTQDALSPSDPAFKNDPNYVNANTGTGNLSDFLALPFLGFNTDFGTKNLHAGWAAYVPFGGAADWSKREIGVVGVPGSKDGPNRWHNISGEILAIYNTFALAYRIEPINLSIGASISPIYHKVSTVRARNADGSDDTISPSGDIIEGRSLINAHGFNIGATAGLYWEPTKELHLGASYNSQPGFGETRMSGDLTTQLGGGQQSKANIDFLQTLPDIIRFGATYQATERLLLRGDMDFTRWSVFKHQCVVNPGADCNVESDGKRMPGEPGQQVQLNVPRNWHDSFSVRIGPAYRVVKELDVFGSVAFATPAVPKTTIDPATVDSQQLFLTLGVKWFATDHWALAGSYNHIWYAPVDTDGVSIQNLRNHPTTSPGGGEYNVSRSPSSDGRYRSQIGFLNVNVAYTF
jgi:long-chain fatty acid transport protein